MNALSRNSQQALNRILLQSLTVGTISAAGLLTGWVPSLSLQSAGLVLDSAAYAQEISQDEITKYARAVLAIEPRRREVYDEIKGMVGTVPPIVCNETRKINTLPGNIRGIIAVNYCDYAKKIIEGNGLSVSRFNQITLNLQADPTLKQRIQAELIRLQQGTSR